MLRSALLEGSWSECGRVVAPREDVEALQRRRGVARDTEHRCCRPVDRYYRWVCCWFKVQPDPPLPQKTTDGRNWAATHWGLSKAQARRLWQEYQATAAYSEEDTVREFVEKFVKPRTRGTGMGLALLENQQKPLAVSVMISHAWDEHAGRFFQDIEALVEDHEHMFVCFLAIYQNEDGCGPSIAAQLGGCIDSGPFAQVIDALVPGRGHGRMLVMTNREIALYTRMWCIWEVYCAIKHDVPVSYSDRGLLYPSETASSRSARCGPPSSPMNNDERAIRQRIERLPVMGQIESVLFVCFIIVAWIYIWWMLAPDKEDEQVMGHTQAAICSFFLFSFTWCWVPSLLAALWLAVLRVCQGDGYARVDSFVRAATDTHRRQRGGLKRSS